MSLLEGTGLCLSSLFKGVATPKGVTAVVVAISATYVSRQADMGALVMGFAAGTATCMAYDPIVRNIRKAASYFYGRQP